MGLFGGSDSDSEDEEETDLSEYRTSYVDSYVPDKAEETDSKSFQNKVSGIESSTVTKDKLTNLNPQSGEFSLNKEPIQDYLQKREEVYFIFHSNRRSVKKQQSQYLEPHSTGGLAIVFTGQKVLLITPKEDSDKWVTLEYGGMSKYEVNTGFMKHKVRLVDRWGRDYTIYINNSYSKNEVELLDEFLDSRIEVAERVSADEYITESWKEKITNPLENRAERISKESDSRTVTKPRLVDTKSDVSNSRVDSGFTNTSIISHLDEDDEVWYILTDKKGGIKTDEWTKEPHTSGQTAFVFTDSRILAIVPGEKNDELIEIKYDEMVSYSNTKDIRFKSQDPRFGVSYAELRVRTEDDTPYVLRILPKYSDECEEWIERVRKKMHDNYVHILLSAGTGRITLEILDRETGEAKMETSGWNYGLGFVERTTSSSKIEKEGYETYATDFVATENGIQVSYKQVEGGSVAMQRTYDEIGAVDMTGSGFIIYASSGIYKFSHRYISDWGNSLGVDADRMKEVGEFIRSKVNEAKSKESDSGGRDTQDNIEKLERLADLRDEGVLTEKEFEEKKQDLLDEI